MQYELADFALTNATLDQSFVLDDLFQINPNEAIQLF